MQVVDSALVMRMGFAVLALALGACAPRGASSADAPTVVDVPTQGAPTPASAPVPTADVTGTWSSASCGARTYERIVTLAADGTFQAWDRVSPCPANAKCIWSGIVTRSGSFRLKGTTLTLQTSAPTESPGVALPDTLQFDGGQLREGSCVYTRS